MQNRYFRWIGRCRRIKTLKFLNLITFIVVDFLLKFRVFYTFAIPAHEHSLEDIACSVFHFYSSLYKVYYFRPSFIYILLLNTFYVIINSKISTHASWQFLLQLFILLLLTFLSGAWPLLPFNASYYIWLWKQISVCFIQSMY